MLKKRRASGGTRNCSLSSYLFSSLKGRGQSESGRVAGAEGVACAQAWVVEGGW